MKKTMLISIIIILFLSPLLLSAQQISTMNGITVENYTSGYCSVTEIENGVYGVKVWLKNNDKTYCIPPLKITQ